MTPHSKLFAVLYINSAPVSHCRTNHLLFSRNILKVYQSHSHRKIIVGYLHRENFITLFVFHHLRQDNNAT